MLCCLSLFVYDVYVFGVKSFNCLLILKSSDIFSMDRIENCEFFLSRALKSDRNACVRVAQSRSFSSSTNQRLSSCTKKKRLKNVHSRIAKLRWAAAAGGAAVACRLRSKSWKVSLCRMNRIPFFPFVFGTAATRCCCMLLCAKLCCGMCSPFENENENESTARRNERNTHQIH